MLKEVKNNDDQESKNGENISKIAKYECVSYKNILYCIHQIILRQEMDENYVCPFCSESRESKVQIDFHLKYGHADIYPLMSETVTKVDLKAKLKRLIEEKKELEKDIDTLHTILEKKPDE
jgi:alpha-N-acetylglucosamine transferase